MSVLPSGGMNIVDAANSLHGHLNDKGVITIGVGDSVIYVYVTSKKIALPESWEGYQVVKRVTGKPMPASV